MKELYIGDFWATQKSLRRINQLGKLVDAILAGEEIPEICLREVDGEYEILNGHHFHQNSNSWFSSSAG